MKKYKIKFGIGNFFSPSQVEVVKIQGFIKGLTAVAAGSTYLATDLKMACIVAVIGFVLDGLTACLYFEEIKNE